MGKVATPGGTFEVSTDITGEILGRRKIQDRGRVQIPQIVRKELHISDGDSVYWIKGLDGRIYITKAVKLR